MRNSKHITTACLRCRRRKVKCDGQPTCSNCRVSNHECTYLANSDKRRTANKVTSALRQRLAQLEEVLRANDIEISPPSPTYQDLKISSSGLEEVNDSSNQRRGSVASHCRDLSTAAKHPPSATSQRSLGLSSSSFGASELSRQSPPLAFPDGRLPDDTDSQDMFLAVDGPSDSEDDAGNDLHISAPNSAHLRQQSQAPFLDDESELQNGQAASLDMQYDMHTESEDDDIASSLTARMGSLQIAEDGQLRYYGPTSNLHISRNGLQSISRSSIRHIANEGREVLKRAGLDHEVPPSVEIHLAKLYFAWEDPSIHVIDEEIFFEEKAARLAGRTATPYYSETLNNSICAIGACLMSGEPLGLPEPAPEFFSLRAKALLDIEMDSPTVATVQALVVMSAIEAAFTRDARGWLYSGMALRLSVDLGLHLDVKDLCRSGVLSQRDIDARRTAFWGVFIHDTMWSVYVGRPWAAGLQHYSTLRPPKELDKTRRKTWRRYPAFNSESASSSEGIFDPLESCTDATITLCALMRKVNRTLYSGHKMSTRALVSFLARAKSEYKGWIDNLDDGVRVDPHSTTRMYTPGVLQLHMQYNAALVALFRPYLPRDNHPWHNSVDAPEDAAVIATVKEDCVAAAHRMTDTLRCYRRQHTLRYTNIQIVHIIFTCCLVHIYIACSNPTNSNGGNEAEASSRATALNDLQFCCQALGEIGRSYGNATRALEVIILFKGEWQRRAALRRTSFSQKTSGVRRQSSSSRPNTDKPGGRGQSQENAHAAGIGGLFGGERLASSAAVAAAMNPPDPFLPSVTDFLFGGSGVNDCGPGLGMQPQAPQVGGGGYGWDPTEEWQRLDWTELGADSVDRILWETRQGGI